MIVRGILHTGDFSDRDAVRKVEVAGVVSREDRVLVGGEHELLLLDRDLVRAVVVRVLLVGHGAVVLPAGQRVGAVGNEARLKRPGARVRAVRIRSLNGSLVNREVGREREEVLEVRAGVLEVDRQRFAVFGSRDVELRVGVDEVAVFIHLGHFRIALDRREHVAVVGSGHRVRRAVPGVNEVVRIERIAVGPLQVVLQRDRVGQAVLGHLHVLGQVVDLLAFLVVGHEARKRVDREAGAVNRGVERRVQLIRLGSEAQTERIGTVVQACKHEILVAERRGVDVRQVFLLQVVVGVEVQRHQGAGLHQHVLCLMHQLGTLCGVRAGADLFDQRVILGPAVDRVHRLSLFSRAGFFRAALRRAGVRRFGRRIRAGCRARVSASREANAHGHDKQKRNQLFHVTPPNFRLFAV